MLNQDGMARRDVQGEDGAAVPPSLAKALGAADASKAFAGNGRPLAEQLGIGVAEPREDGNRSACGNACRGGPSGGCG